MAWIFDFELGLVNSFFYPNLHKSEFRPEMMILSKSHLELSSDLGWWCSLEKSQAHVDLGQLQSTLSSSIWAIFGLIQDELLMIKSQKWLNLANLDSIDIKMSYKIVMEEILLGRPSVEKGFVIWLFVRKGEGDQNYKDF